MCAIHLMFVVITTILCLEGVVPAPRKPRLTVAEPMPSYYNTDIGGDPGTYSFGYDVWDPATGNTQFRSEERYPNGTVAGSYGYVDPLGETRTFRYTADERGYRVKSERKVEDQSNNIANLVIPTTESSITWMRPSKKTQKNKETNVFQRRKYNDVQPPGYYLLY
ncbi:uncharacterized protein [Epargyreus clarus]|uniref:uncharacterized protein n=1 Tax=Epargyreus clarus TaxID=520877 RepID=UPI003C2B2C7B